MPVWLIVLLILAALNYGGGAAFAPYAEYSRTPTPALVIVVIVVAVAVLVR